MTETERLRAALERIRALVNTDCDDEDAITAMLHELDSIATATLAPPEPTPDTRPALTPRQAEVLAYIATTRRTHGYSPTVREMMQATGIKSPNGVVCHLKALEKKGYIDRNVYLSRAIVPVEAS